MIDIAFKSLGVIREANKQMGVPQVVNARKETFGVDYYFLAYEWKW